MSMKILTPFGRFGSNTQSEKEQLLLLVLGKYPEGLTATELKEKTTVDKLTIKKYLEKLVAKGRVRKIKFGRSTLYKEVKNDI